ncbi:hypothetical protein SAMN05216188_10518 [Lentzea xinjiangensis]|uniref:Uncharacterized protein n=1 Tax=Lentzea xinjiangensis TaxID=402600 RepID=A0A1H9IP23_9PSEU|nr:hypothetical protein [Lentzea xinjiangensis]SEQ76308.1 hypothetical protein SAMN05216188_10518 [Lentzea xinjiangensis]
MKRLIVGTLGVSMLLTCGVLTSAAQAEPGLHVTCARTLHIEHLDGGLFAISAAGCSSEEEEDRDDRGVLTLLDHGSARFECGSIELSEDDEDETVLAVFCTPSVPDGR